MDGQGKKQSHTRNSTFLVILILLALALFGWYQLSTQPPPSERSPTTGQPLDQSSSKPNDEVIVSGTIGVTNCESPGPGCNTVSVTDSEGKQWNLMLNNDQNKEIRSFKRIKVHGKAIDNTNNNTLKVNSYEALQ